MDISSQATEELEDRVVEPDNEMLAEYADYEYGLLVQLKPGETADFGLPPETAAVVCWSGVNEEPPTELRRLTQEEADLLRSNYGSTVAEQIIRHYRANPADDGHPAYALYDLYRRLQESHAGASENRA